MRTLLFLSLIIVSLPSFCETKIEAAISIIHEEKLYENDQWKRLLHYWEDESTILTESFFISPEGSYNYQHELIETLKALSKPESKYELDKHPQCLFPARKLWLEKKLAISDLFPNVNCPSLDNWRDINRVDSISLLFVSGYLSNPASFFGHVLLKMNADESKSITDSPLLDMSVNYGASIGEGDGPLKYVFYGLFGGYNAEYTMENYFVYDSTYAELENRVLWEYELNLNDFEVLLLEQHLWELKDKQFKYYFLNRNCATQLAYILKMVTGVDITTPNQPWDMPIDLFKNLVKVNYNGKPLVSRVLKRDSKYTRMHRKYTQLSDLEKKAAKKITHTPDNFNSITYKNLSDESKAKVLSVLYDYYELIKNDTKDESDFSELKRKLLLENLKLPPQSIAWNEPKTAPPHQAQNPKKIGFSYGYNTDSKQFGQLELRLGYYDYLSLEASRYRDSNATFFDTEIRYNDSDGVYLNKLTLFDISTLNLLDVDLFNNNQHAWNLKFSIENENLSCQSCLTPKFTAGIGLADRYFNAVSIYAMPKAILDLDTVDRSLLGVDIGLLYTSNSFIKSRISVIPVIVKDSSNSTELITVVENRFGNSKYWDIRAKVLHNVETELSISISSYF